MFEFAEDAKKVFGTYEADLSQQEPAVMQMFSKKTIHTITTAILSCCSQYIDDADWIISNSIDESTADWSQDDKSLAIVENNVCEKMLSIIKIFGMLQASSMTSHADILFSYQTKIYKILTKILKMVIFILQRVVN